MKLKTLILTLGTAAVVFGGAVNSAVTIKGSDTLLILNQRWAEAFGQRSNVAVNVTGGGSSIGIRAFISGTADIAASSRAMRRSEIASARSRGAVATEIPVALDGLAVIVNDDNKIPGLTMDQLRRIYIGQVTNWNQVGGSNTPITAFSRNSNSGTFGFFQERVLRNQNWGKGVRFMGSTADELRETRNSPGGIAYGGVAYFKGQRGVRIVPIEGIAPDETNVRGRKYPIWRFLYYYTNGAPKGETKQFVDFVLSPEGQRIAEQVGYYSLR